MCNSLREHRKRHTRMLPEPILHSDEIKAARDEHNSIDTLHSTLHHTRHKLLREMLKALLALVLRACAFKVLKGM